MVGKMLKLIKEQYRENFNQNKFPALDPTTPWYNFTLYCESCYSLGFKPSLSSYIRYNTYYKSLFKEK
jgi:hypothetical protein